MSKRNIRPCIADLAGLCSLPLSFCFCFAATSSSPLICQPPLDLRGLWLSLSGDLVLLLDPSLFSCLHSLLLLEHLGPKITIHIYITNKDVPSPSPCLVFSWACRTTYHATYSLSHLMSHQILPPTYQVQWEPQFPQSSEKPQNDGLGSAPAGLGMLAEALHNFSGTCKNGISVCQKEPLPYCLV